MHLYIDKCSSCEYKSNKYRLLPEPPPHEKHPKGNRMLQNFRYYNKTPYKHKKELCKINKLALNYKHHIQMVT